MRDIADKLSELYYRTDSCVRCGRCTTVCPTFSVSLKESMVARGRIRLAREYVEEKLDLSNKLKLYNDLCLGCNACMEVCPPRIKTGDLVNLMKLEIAQKNGSSLLDSVLLKGVINTPQSFRKAVSLLSMSRKMGMSYILPQSLKDKEQILPSIPKQSFRDIYRPKNGSENKKTRVGYFVGCVTNALFPDIALDVIRVLEYHNCEVIVPTTTVCCGLPHRASGGWKAGNVLASKNIDLFNKEKVDYIVTDCGTCGHALKEYAEFFAGQDNEGKAKDFSAKVYDINEFLVDIIGLIIGDMLLPSNKVTYHESCHLNRGQKVSQQPKTILRSLPGIQYVEMPESNWCCGAAGSFSFKHQDTALKILERKINNVRETEAGIITAGCPSCLMQLDYGRRRFGLNYQVKHPVQLISQTLG